MNLTTSSLMIRLNEADEALSKLNDEKSVMEARLSVKRQSVEYLKQFAFIPYTFSAVLT
jgi:hypothetical protein